MKNKGASSLRIVITCDVDPDWPHIPYKDSKRGIVSKPPKWLKREACNLNSKSDKLRWQGIEEGIKSFYDEFNSADVKVTWYIRSDWMMNNIYDDWAWPFVYYSDLWRKLLACGHELGWHPHLHRYSEATGVWHQEIKDEKWMRGCLETGFYELKKKAPAPLYGWTSKMGWDFHNNFTMRLISGIGLKADFSANPGLMSRTIYGAVNESEKEYFINYYDWSKTPEMPYFPSEDDYMIPAKNSGRTLPILEIPITIHRAYRLGRIPTLFAKKIIYKLKNKKVNLSLPLTLNSGMELFNRAVEYILKNRRAYLNSGGSVIPYANYIHMDFHSYDLLEPGCIERVKCNLKSLVSIAKKRGFSVEYCTASSIANIITHDLMEMQKSEDFP